MKRAALIVAALLASCSSTSEWTAEDTRLLAMDLRDALDAAKPLLGDNADAYVAAVQQVIDAALEDPDGNWDWADAFRMVRALEPQARQALIANGETEERADAILALARIALRRLEQALGSRAPAESPATTSRPSQ